MRVNRKVWYIVGAIAMTVVAAVAGLLLLHSPGPASQQGKQATVEVQRGDVNQLLTVYGSVVPKQQYTFTFAGDRIKQMLASVGERVEAGQVLVKLDDTQQQLAMLQADQALQEAKVEGIPSVIQQRELSYQVAQANYQAATLRAPFSGVVADITQPTSSSENWSLVLLDTSQLYIEANVDQLDAPNVAVGQSAQATIEPLPDESWPVEIVQVGGMAITRGNSTMVVVTGKLPQADPSILVGYSAEMDITIASAQGVLRVPISSLVQAGRGWAVVKMVNGAPQQEAVTLGVRSDSFAEVTDGVSEGDVILLNPSASSPPSSVPSPSRSQGNSLPFGGRN